jgi:malate dehydrogenase (oxaloacetate-decarboxylating)
MDRSPAACKGVRTFETKLKRYLFLRGLQDSNETLLYTLLRQHLAEMLPLVYTPTVREGCQEFSHYSRYPRGLFLSWPHRYTIKDITAHLRFDSVEVIVVSDGERILAWATRARAAIGIPVGELSLYTACAGIDPATTLPILLDLGPDNQEPARRPALYRLEARTRARDGL